MPVGTADGGGQEGVCCGQGICCDQPCEVCIDNGALDASGATIDVSPPTACLGDTIAFTISGVVDNGGIMVVDCSSKMPILPVTPDYTWEIVKPDATTVTGTGAIASAVADQAGGADVNITIAHELGHAQGLDHPDEHGDPDPENLMHSNYENVWRLRKNQWDAVQTSNP